MRTAHSRERLLALQVAGGLVSQQKGQRQRLDCMATGGALLAEVVAATCPFLLAPNARERTCRYC